MRRGNDGTTTGSMDIEALVACLGIVVGWATMREVQSLVGFLSCSTADACDLMEVDASGWEATAKPIVTNTSDKMDIDNFNPPSKKGRWKRRHGKKK
ncbi:MAG: hypothetical protein M1840_001544 [Geoglossum simile]|nr:MAG: hypothetical protein M1840_001544 [Geoglossum simile]